MYADGQVNRRPQNEMDANPAGGHPDEVAVVVDGGDADFPEVVAAAENVIDEDAIGLIRPIVNHYENIVSTSLDVGTV